jgi:hypothetical protein
MNKQLDAEDDVRVFIGVSTVFGHHHAHHQENGTKPTANMVYTPTTQTNSTHKPTAHTMLHTYKYRH